MQRACLDTSRGKTYAHNALWPTYPHITEQHIKLIVYFIVFNK
jgi:hypothetical protein